MADDDPGPDDGDRHAAGAEQVLDFTAAAQVRGQGVRVVAQAAQVDDAAQAGTGSRLAAIENRPLLLLPVPLLTPWLSSLWLTLVTDIDIGTGQALIDSMTNEVTVRDHSIRELIPIQPMSYDDAVRAALRERREARQARS